MYNLRYHIASLVAVFLALSVGLVLGSIVVERGTIDRQQAALVNSLQKDFVRINAENRALEARAKSSEEFEDALVADVTDGLLEERTILVLANAGRTDGLSSAVDAIERAGGRAAVAMVQTARFGLDSPEGSSAATEVLGELSSGSLQESVVTSLAAEWAGPGPRPLTDALVDARVLRVEGLPDGTAVDGMLVLESWEGAADDVALALASAVRDQEVTVVGGQSAGSSAEVADTFAQAGFSAVNDLDTPRGEYSVVVLLTGSASGYYGTGPQTDGPFPPVPSQTASQP